MNNKKSYIFIAQNDETGGLFAGRQEDIDRDILYFEENGLELIFKIIAKIPEPPNQRTLMDFDEKLIEWYDTDKEISSELIKSAIQAIATFIINDAK